MSDDVLSWFRDKFRELQDTENYNECLIEMKSAFNALDVDSLQLIATTIDFHYLFEILQYPDSSIVESAADIIDVLFNSLSAQDVLQKYGSQINHSLNHKSPSVKRVMLKTLQKNVSVQSIQIISREHPGILNQVIECLAYPDRGIAEGAVSFFKKIGKSVEGVQLLFSNGFVDVLKNIMIINDISRFRVYEIVIDIAVSSNEGFQTAHESTILPSLLNELKSDDPLIQLNALEILTHLTVSSQGPLYLQREGVIQYLVDKITNMKDDCLSLILLPGLIEFFGNLCKLQPSVFGHQHPDVINILFKSFETVDPALLSVAITSVAKIGSSDEGKSVLFQQSENLQLFFKKIGNILLSRNELCVTAMNCLSVLFTTDQAEMSAALKEWFDELDPRAFQAAIDHTRMPFVELRLSALEFLHTISKRSWGVIVVCQHPLFLEFLMNREAEFDKDCKHARFSIISTLVADSMLQGQVSSEVFTRLERYVSEGPFFVSSQPEIAFLT